MQGDLSALNRCGKANVAKPDLRKGHQIGCDDDIDISGGCFEANLNILWTHYEPPIARAAITLGNAAEVETNDETLRRYFPWIDLPSHAPHEHLRIEVIRTDQSLSPTLAPYAHQLDD